MINSARIPINSKIVINKKTAELAEMRESEFWGKTICKTDYDKIKKGTLISDLINDGLFLFDDDKDFKNWQTIGEI